MIERCVTIFTLYVIGAVLSKHVFWPFKTQRDSMKVLDSSTFTKSHLNCTMQCLEEKTYLVTWGNGDQVSTSCGAFRLDKTSWPDQCELGTLDIDKHLNNVYLEGDVLTYVKLTFSADHCFFKLQQRSMSGWTGAKKFCERLGAKLPEPRTSEELTKASILMSKPPIGLKQVPENSGTWRWVSDNSDSGFTLDSTHHCARLNTAKPNNFETIDCNARLHFECQIC